MTPLSSSMYLCLDCRACETACPSHVEFGDLMERARGQLNGTCRAPGKNACCAAWFFMSCSPTAGAWNNCSTPALVPASRAITLIRRVRLFDLLPGRLKNMATMLPSLPSRPFMRSVPEAISGQAPVGNMWRFTGCVMDYSTLRCITPAVEYCRPMAVILAFHRSSLLCALHMHAGERQQARYLARRNISVFEQYQVDATSTTPQGVAHSSKPTANCSQMIRSFPHGRSISAPRCETLPKCSGKNAHGPLGSCRNGWCTMIPATSSMPSASSTSHGSCCSKFPMCNSSLSVMPILLWSSGDLQPDPAQALATHSGAQNRAHQSRPARRDRHR